MKTSGRMRENSMEMKLRKERESLDRMRESLDRKKASMELKEREKEILDWKRRHKEEEKGSDLQCILVLLERKK